MATVAKIGPEDHGRPMSVDEFTSGDYQDGFQYELIDGKLYVSPEAGLPADWVEKWLFSRVWLYTREHPEIINHVTDKARLFIPGRIGITNPEPDLAAYHGFPVHQSKRNLDWRDFSPILVGEILAEGAADKDLVRNVHLYLLVPSIKEYWVLDPRTDPDRPTLRVYRRHGGRWRIIDFAFGETYTTRLLPGFRLVIDPNS